MRWESGAGRGRFNDNHDDIGRWSDDFYPDPKDHDDFERHDYNIGSADNGHHSRFDHDQGHDVDDGTADDNHTGHYHDHYYGAGHHDDRDTQQSWRQQELFGFLHTERGAAVV